MTDVRKLIGKLAEQEARLQQTTFLAPCVRGGSVKTRIEGMVYTFTPVPPDAEGWGLFHPIDGERAQWIEEAGLMQVEAYLKLFPAFRVRLAFRMQHRTWLAYPANESDVRQRLGQAHPILVHLVEHGTALEQIVARWDGAAWWFEAEDRRADPRFADALRQALRQETEPEALRQSGLTPEMRTVYSLAFSRTDAGRARRQQRIEAERTRRQAERARQQQQRDEARLGEALAFAGGQLRDFQDRDDYWLVEWLTPDGQRHHSAINKQDLTVISAGICLSDQDRDFDLQSLVGVMTDRPDWME